MQVETQARCDATQRLGVPVQVFLSELGVAVDAKQGQIAAVIHVFRILRNSMICKQGACAGCAASGSLVGGQGSVCVLQRWKGGGLSANSAALACSADGPILAASSGGNRDHHDASVTLRGFRKFAFRTSKISCSMMERAFFGDVACAHGTTRIGS